MANFIRKLVNSSFNVDDTEKILNSMYTNSPTMENHILMLISSITILEKWRPGHSTGTHNPLSKVRYGLNYVIFDSTPQAPA